MEQYIPKSALVAEIKKLRDTAFELYGISQFNSAYNNVLKSIDTLEVKEVQEEPESEGKDIFDNCLKSEEKFILSQKISGNINCENCLYSSACALGDIQACIIDKPVS